MQSKYITQISHMYQLPQALNSPPVIKTVTAEILIQAARKQWTSKLLNTSVYHSTTIQAQIKTQIFSGAQQHVNSTYFCT